MKVTIVDTDKIYAVLKQLNHCLDYIDCLIDLEDLEEAGFQELEELIKGLLNK